MKVRNAQSHERTFRNTVNITNAQYKKIKKRKFFER